MHDMGGRDSFHVEKNQPDLMKKRNIYEVAILYEFVQCDSYGFFVKNVSMKVHLEKDSMHDLHNYFVFSCYC